MAVLTTKGWIAILILVSLLSSAGTYYTFNKTSGIQGLSVSVIPNISSGECRLELTSHTKPPSLDFNTRITQRASHRVTAEYERSVFLVEPGGYWKIFCTSYSMHPTFDCKDTLIAYKPDSEEEIHTGDIIGFDAGHGEHKTHRIISKKQDQQGTYYKTLGDTNIVYFALYNQSERIIDEKKVRFEDIDYKIIGILYG